MSADRRHAIVAGFLAEFESEDVRLLDPAAAFRRLAERVPDLDAAELSGAGDLARTIASEMRSLGHRVEREREHERRRSATR